MSKVTIEVDTKKKTIVVAVDGKKLSGIESVNVYTSSDSEYPYMEVSMTKSDTVGDLRSVTRFMASESKEGKEAIRRGEASTSEFADFVAVEGKSGVQQDIESFLGQK